jgi:hypothetical protein
MRNGVLMEEKFGEVRNQENEIPLPNNTKHQTHYFLPIWKGVVCFFERGDILFKNFMLNP